MGEVRNLPIRSVPNVPCGVERIGVNTYRGEQPTVPNVPCGVERLSTSIFSPLIGFVPNAPCGVESAERG